jgi:hypothetical protein
VSKRLIVILLAMVATIALAAQVSAAEAETENPLEPLDTSSPRAAYLAFIEQAGVIEKAVLEYRSNRSTETQNAFFEAVAKTGELSDLSEVAAAKQDQVVVGNFAALADILMRIPLPDRETIPDADQVTADGLTQWIVPGTEITFRPLEEGDRAGAWVLTPSTVAGLTGWRREVEGLPAIARSLSWVPGMGGPVWRVTLTVRDLGGEPHCADPSARVHHRPDPSLGIPGSETAAAARRPVAVESDGAQIGL